MMITVSQEKVAHENDIFMFPPLASVMQTHQTEQQSRHPELQAPPSPPQSEEQSSDLIRPQKPLNPVTASKSHQELHKELRMTHERL